MITFPVAAFGGLVEIPVFVESSTSQVSSSTTHTVTMPASILEGDLIVIYAGGSDAAGQYDIDDVTTGYTKQQDGALTDENRNRFDCWTKVAGVSEGSATVTFSDSGFHLAVVLLYRKSSTIAIIAAPVQATSTNATNTSSAWNDTAGVALVGLWGNRDGADNQLNVSTPPVGLTLRASRQGSAGPSARDRRIDIYEKIMDGGGSETAVTVYDQSDIVSISHGIEMR